MGAVLNFFDRLVNVMSGMGTTADKRAAAFYALQPLTPQEAEAAYRSSWLVRKIIDIPPFDMTREWRDWQTDSDAIQKIEAEEKRLQIKAKCQRALVLARLFGGGALLLGTGDANTEEPIRPEVIKANGLRYVHVVSRHQLSEGQARLDPEDAWFMQPDFFSMTGANGRQIKLHPSRVVAFVGQKAPEGSMWPSTSWFWGDPLMQSIGEAVKNADLSQSGFASLIDEAKIDVIKIPDMMNNVGSSEYEKRLLDRLGLANLGKSNWRALILDGAEEWEQKQITWAGMPEIMLAFMDVVAGAADIPLTRLLGQSPRGLQSTGDGEERDYHSMVKARQSELLSPALDQIDALLLPSALGAVPSDIYYEFAPLDNVSETDAADIEFKLSQSLKNYSDMAVFPEAALSAIAKNRMIESGRWPGSEAAFEEAAANPEPAPNESDLLTLEQRVAAMEQSGTITKPQADAILKDAAPRTLYVSRKLLNADALVAWAKGQGFETTVPADQMHVAICYSRAPVDWMAMGQAWGEDSEGRLRVAPGGARMLDVYGNLKQAIVLLFNSSDLCWRHEQLEQAGATHDYDEYQPHVTITYEAPAGFDMAAVEPYRGELIFGPEIFEEVNEDWSQSIEEE
jgi:hypothetical protein